eukprot:CAMPEP_0114984976 /NCGR_PEP_ID=MMETSP0216-20121206/7590_1 /TAXON_ID=223996 /ORGANISM="Protocruzia adherens, Strain Boccale" /LENGTH=1353 /DNA_ID=CAMNT_0002347201 /DNA_START=273 /DNA_END=4334 /DNA_ORIENTATION=+
MSSSQRSDNIKWQELQQFQRGNIDTSLVADNSPPSGDLSPHDRRTNSDTSSDGYFANLWGSLKIVSQYLLSDIQKRQRSYRVGVFTVFIVVTFIILIQNALESSPYIFLRIAENEASEADFIMFPLSAANDTSLADGNEPGNVLDRIRLLNYPEVHEQTKHLSDIEGSSPRWYFFGTLTNADDLDKSTSAYIVAGDSKMENEIGLGRKLDKRILGPREAYVSSSALRVLDINANEGNHVNLTLDLFKTISTTQIIDGAPDDLDVAFVEEILQDLFGINTDEPVRISTSDLGLQNFTVNIGDNEVTIPVELLTDNLQQIVDNVNDQLDDNDADDNSTQNAVNDLADQIADTIGDFNEAFNDFLEDNNIADDVDNVVDAVQDQANGDGGDSGDGGRRRRLWGYPKECKLQNRRLDTEDNEDPDTDEKPKNEEGDDKPEEEEEKKEEEEEENNVTEIEIPLDTLVELALPFIREALKLSYKYNVVDAVESPQGKWPNALGNVIFIDSRYIPEMLATNLEGAFEALSLVNPFFLAFQSQVRDFFETIREADIEEYALTINFMIKNRAEIYSNVDNAKAGVGSAINSVYGELGPDHKSTIQMPLYTALSNLEFIKYLLDTVFVSVVFFLGFLSILLIYSLMIAEVDEKTYEYGMLRALGLKQNSLISMLLMHALAFAIPGLCAGLLVSYLLSIPVKFGISLFTGIVPDYDTSWLPIVTGIAIGIVMPLISNIIPIQRALSKTLRDALDVFHNIINETMVTIIKLEHLGVSPPVVCVGAMLTILGVVFYYGLPYTFFTRQFGLFMMLLNSILILMVLGLVFLGSMIQPLLERLFLKVLFLFARRDRHMHKIVEMNLRGHRRRNKKTALMFIVALSFLIFAGSGFRLVGSVIIGLIEQVVGSDISVLAPQKDNLIGLNEFEMRKYLDDYKDGPKGNLVKNYAFTTVRLHRLESLERKDVTLSNLGGFPEVATSIVGVERTYLESTFQDYILLDEKDDSISYPELNPSGISDVVHGLYTNAGISQYNGDPDVQEVLGGQWWSRDSILRNEDILGSDADPKEKEDDAEKNRRVLEEEFDTTPKKVICAEGLRDYMTIDTKTSISLEAKDRKYRARIRAMMSKVPGYFFSGYRQAIFFSVALVSFEDYFAIAEDNVRPKDWDELKDSVMPNSTFGLPKYRLFVKTVGGIDVEDKENLINGLRTYFRDDQTQLLNTSNFRESIQLATDLMEIFFTLVGSVALILAFFLLWVSFIGNVRENAWEYGILRSVGLTGLQVSRLYIYEALAITITATISGTIIGLTIGSTMILQFNVFLELPFKMQFPVTLFSVMVVSAIAIAILGSWIPTEEIRKRKIAHVLKGIEN